MKLRHQMINLSEIAQQQVTELACGPSEYFSETCIKLKVLFESYRHSRELR